MYVYIAGNKWISTACMQNVPFIIVFEGQLEKYANDRRQ